MRLREARHQHVSWPRSEGLLLMGGQFPAGASTELVSWDGTRTEESFTMKYWETSLACGVADTETETIIITGGVAHQDHSQQLLHQGLAGGSSLADHWEVRPRLCSVLL